MSQIAAILTDILVVAGVLVLSRHLSKTGQIIVGVGLIILGLVF